MSKKKKITTSTGVEVRHKPLGLRIWNNRGYYVMVAAVKRLFELIPQADFRRTVLNSFLRIGGGFMLALIMGTVLAALSAGYKLMRTLISPLMTAVKAVPVASFIIFALFFMKSFI